jgi:hypothetical protein
MDTSGLHTAGGENRSTTAIFEIQQKDDNENNSFAFFVFCLFGWFFCASPL